jgi:hypothetical protein
VRFWLLFGAIWFLQGINVLPGSFMTGQIRWAIFGGFAVAAGFALFFAGGSALPTNSGALWRIIGSGVAVLIDWQAAVYSDVAARAGGVD